MPGVLSRHQQKDHTMLHGSSQPSLEDQEGFEHRVSHFQPPGMADGLLPGTVSAGVADAMIKAQFGPQGGPNIIDRRKFASDCAVAMRRSPAK